MQKLKDLRAERGLSLDDLARRAGMSKTGVWHLETEQRNPSLRTVQKLAHALGVPWEKLAAEFNREAPMVK